MAKIYAALIRKGIKTLDEVPARLRNTVLRPDLIIPFKLDKKAAKAKLQEKYAQSAKRLQEQNAAYTKFCADNDLKPYHERLAVTG